MKYLLKLNLVKINNEILMIESSRKSNSTFLIVGAMNFIEELKKCIKFFIQVIFLKLIEEILFIT